MRWCLAVLLFASCVDPDDPPPPPGVRGRVLDFGAVRLGSSSTAMFTLENGSTTTYPVTLSLEGSEFSLAEDQVTVPGQGSATVELTFTPAARGPRFGKVALAWGDSRSSTTVTGAGVVASLSVPAQVTLPEAALLPATPVVRATGELLISNAIDGQSLRVIREVVASDPALCVGEFTDAGCAGFTQTGVAAGSALHVPLSVVFDEEGSKRFSVTVRTDDPEQPELVSTVSASARAYETCALDLPPEFLIVGNSQDFLVHHSGVGACLVLDVTARAPPGAVLSISPSPLSHVAVDTDHPLHFWLSVPFFQTALGTVHLVPAGSPPLDVPVRLGTSSGCISASPPSLEFGEVPLGCTKWQTQTVWSSCGVSEVLSNISVQASLADFAIGPQVPPQLVLDAFADAGASIPVAFTPYGLGPRSASLTMQTSDFPTPQLFFPMFGVGVAREVEATVVVPEVVPPVDSIVIVDTSSSFAPRRPAVREALQTALTRASCADARIVFLPAEGAADASVPFVGADGGAPWIDSASPDFVAMATAAFDALPVGSERESCVAVLERVWPTLSLRPTAQAQVLCVTDARDSLPDAGAHFQALRSSSPVSLRFDAVVATRDRSTCMVEAFDDGTFARLSSATGGVLRDVCAPEFRDRLGGQCRATFFFDDASAQAPAVVLAGQVLDGGFTWDPVQHSVTLDPQLAQPGQAFTVRYQRACP